MSNKVEVYNLADSFGIEERVVIKNCRWCGFESVFLMTSDQFKIWHGPDYATEILPYIDINVREILTSGVHPECWNEMIRAREISVLEDEDQL